MRAAHIACISATLLAAPTSALAQEAKSQVVRYADLDLDSAAGADVLIRRITLASANVCGDRPGPRPLIEHRTVTACQSQTAETAVADVNHPVVTARYYGSGYAIVEGSDNPYESRD